MAPSDLDSAVNDLGVNRYDRKFGENRFKIVFVFCCEAMKPQNFKP